MGGYAAPLIEAAEQTLSARRQRAKQEAAARREELFRQIPRLAEIQFALAQTGLRAVRAALSGGESLTRIQQENLALQAEQAQLLRQCGLAEDALFEQPVCPICRDEGYVDGHRCACFEKLVREQGFLRINRISAFSLCDFSNFDLSFYPTAPGPDGVSPRDRMQDIFRFCEHYAAHFSLQSPNILMTGATGLGKTHLSLSIAKKVLKADYGVVYISAPDFFAQAERERFSRELTQGETLQLLLECDLLILDDLGAEFSTSFTLTTLYHLINSRLNRGLPCVVSTNLSLQEMVDMYQDRIVSRIIGSYTMLRFYGRDIRQIKAMQA